jgi:16S rRNA (uracil1498-N3)-methyltransferase
VARAAAAQCRSPWLPEVTGVTSLPALCAAEGDRLRLAHPGGGRPSLARPVLVVGPEGGWEPDELDAAGGTVGLGPTVLRAETAAVVAGALLCALRSGTVSSLA